MIKRISGCLVPLGVILLGVLITAVLVVTRPRADRGSPERVLPSVGVVEAAPSSVPAQIVATGQVVAEQQVALVPQVSGQITWVAQGLAPGRRFSKGETIARIDPRDYELALRQERSRVEQAQLALELEQQRQQTAEEGWKLLGEGRAAEDAPLALRGPQLKVAQVALEAAQGAQDQAELRLERTRLRAPFDCIVVDENLDVGQTVGAAGAVATLVGTRAVRVDLSVPVDRLALVQVPGVNAQEGSTVQVRQTLEGTQAPPREGVITGLAGQLEPQSRTARLVARVADPLDGDVPLLPGAFVEASILGAPLDGAIAVPRIALTGGDKVWVVTPGEPAHLARRDLTIAFGDEEEVYATAGVEPGELLLSTPLALPIDGMAVQIGSQP